MIINLLVANIANEFVHCTEAGDGFSQLIQLGFEGLASVISKSMPFHPTACLSCNMSKMLGAMLGTWSART